MLKETAGQGPWRSGEATCHHKKHWFLGIRKVWVQILALPWPGCVTLGKSLNFSGPSFPSDQMGLQWGYCEDYMRLHRERPGRVETT